MVDIFSLQLWFEEYNYNLVNFFNFLLFLFLSFFNNILDYFDDMEIILKSKGRNDNVYYFIKNLVMIGKVWRIWKKNFFISLKTWGQFSHSSQIFFSFYLFLELSKSYHRSYKLNIFFFTLGPSTNWRRPSTN